MPPSSTPSTPAASRQLGLDFDATTAAPPAPPPHAWRSPPLPAATELGKDALAMACAIQNPALARALMELPERWDFNAGHQPGVGTSEGFPSPIVHLLAARESRHWSPPENPHNFNAVTATALSMVERGADFLQTPRGGVNAIALCAISRRQAFFEGLVGHPRFTHALMGEIRVGALPPPDSNPLDDTRRPLLGHLIATGQLSSAGSLISSAGFPPNGIDPDGRLPIGYCRSPEAVETLLGFGALPGLVDGHGLNALARVQKVSDTETRDRMITLIAHVLKKEAKSNPSLMSTLQAQNIAALLEAAENAPKSSLLKTISAFKFDVSKARDPKTLLTPLMAACLGGRMASAQHLLAAGSDINAVDANGVPASAYLLSGAETSSGPRCLDLVKANAASIDLSARSKRGWPVAMEAAFLMGASPLALGWTAHPAAILANALESLPKPIGASLVSGDDGTCLMEAYALGQKQGLHRHQQGSENFSALMSIAESHGSPDLLDRALTAILMLDSSPAEATVAIRAPWANLAHKIESRISSSPQPCHHTARFLQTRPELAAKLAAQMPSLYSHIETAALLSIATPGSRARLGSRL